MFQCQICQNVQFVFKYFFFLGPFPDFFFFLRNKMEAFSHRATLKLFEQDPAHSMSVHNYQASHPQTVNP